MLMVGASSFSLKIELIPELVLGESFFIFFIWGLLFFWMLEVSEIFDDNGMWLL